MEDLRLGGNVKSSDDYFIQKKVEIMIDTNNKRVASELDNIKSMINRLNEDIHEIKRNLSGNNGFMPKKEPAIVSESFRDNNQNDLKAKNNEPQKPRSGDYQPEDVSVHKFFYFGTKK